MCCAAQLGVLTVQFDQLVKTRKSPESFLSEEKKKEWMGVIGEQLLGAAATQTREAQRDAQRLEKKDEAGGKKGGKAKGGKDKGGKTQAEMTLSGIPALCRPNPPPPRHSRPSRVPPAAWS